MAARYKLSVKLYGAMNTAAVAAQCPFGDLAWN